MKRTKAQKEAAATTPMSSPVEEKIQNQMAERGPPGTDERFLVDRPPAQEENSTKEL